jgi:hypothetical protein
MQSSRTEWGKTNGALTPVENSFYASALQLSDAPNQDSVLKTSHVCNPWGRNSAAFPPLPLCFMAGYANRFPGTAQYQKCVHARFARAMVVRCRTAIIAGAEFGMIPDQRCTVSRCTASRRCS